MRRLRTHLAGLVAGALVGLAAQQASAGALRVSPVGLDLVGGQAAATLTLRNDDDTPMDIQIRVFRWSQTASGEVLTPTDEVVVSPPIAPIAAHSERVVRVVRLAQGGVGEQAYRVMVDELPGPPNSAAPQVRFLMRHSIPVFFTPGASGAARVDWRATLMEGQVSVAGHNSGARRLRINNLRLLDSDGAPVVTHEGLMGYVLPGAAVDWRLPVEGKAAHRPVRLTADSDAGPIDVPLPAAP